MSAPHTHGGTDAPECTSCASQRRGPQVELTEADKNDLAWHAGGISLENTVRTIIARHFAAQPVIAVKGVKPEQVVVMNVEPEPRVVYVPIPGFGGTGGRMRVRA